MLSRVSHILPLTTIRRARQLPCSGKILARSGQKISANDVIAEATLPSRHLMLDIERGLGLPAEKADELVQPQPGDLVQEGEVLAGPVGIMSRVVRAPQSGRVVAVRGGRLLLELETTTINVKAGFSGTVAELIPDRGAYIEAVGSLVQGFWGNGRIDVGMILMAVKKPDEEMTPDKLDVSMRGAVIVCGSCNAHRKLVIANNTISGGTGYYRYGIYLSGAIYSLHDIRIGNNVLFNNAAGSYSYAIYRTSTSGILARVENNLFTQIGGFLNSGAEYTTLSSMETYLNGQGTVASFNKEVAAATDLYFANYAGRDWQPTASSPLSLTQGGRDTSGLDWGTVVEDRLGNPRTVLYSIGAYEMN